MSGDLFHPLTHGGRSLHLHQLDALDDGGARVIDAVEHRLWFISIDGSRDRKISIAAFSDVRAPLVES